MGGRARKKLAYSVHPTVAYATSVIENLPERTGKSLSEWVALVQEDGPEGVKERRAWLKKEYSLGMTTAYLIAEKAEGGGDEWTDEAAYLKKAEEYVATMYSGGKESLQPIHEALLRLAVDLGDDVKVCPCKTIVPLYRHHVFAEIKPATRTRIDSSTPAD